jgi:hypothetical protein
LRLGRWSLMKRFGPAMMDSLNGVRYLLYRVSLVKSLDMENNTFAGARIDEKTGEPEGLA